jgi:hypothetical protein
VTTVEIDGVVLADEATPPETAAVKPPAKPAQDPANAVRAGDAVLAR